jgi:nickel/cobalt transporter (NicO) family protein
MLESALYLVSSFWLGAVHAATPGHGKTASAAYLVGTRGRPADAFALGIFVTLAHTSGITIFALLATLGSATLSQRSESYVSLAMALLMFGLGVSLLVGRSHPLRHVLAHALGRQHPDQANAHAHFGARHAHNFELLNDGRERPSWGLLLGLGLAGGLLPDPAALAVLLAAIAAGKLVLGLLTVFVFSLGFASVLVVVGVVVGRLGQLVLEWTHSRWVDWLQLAVAGLITVVGAIMSVGAWRQVSEWR